MTTPAVAAPPTTAAPASGELVFVEPNEMQRRFELDMYGVDPKRKVAAARAQRTRDCAAFTTAWHTKTPGTAPAALPEVACPEFATQNTTHNTTTDLDPVQGADGASAAAWHQVLDPTYDLSRIMTRVIVATPHTLANCFIADGTALVGYPGAVTNANVPNAELVVDRKVKQEDYVVTDDAQTKLGVVYGVSNEGESAMPIFVIVRRTAFTRDGLLARFQKQVGQTRTVIEQIKTGKRLPYTLVQPPQLTTSAAAKAAEEMAPCPVGRFERVVATQEKNIETFNLVCAHMATEDKYRQALADGRLRFVMYEYMTVLGACMGKLPLVKHVMSAEGALGRRHLVARANRHVVRVDFTQRAATQNGGTAELVLSLHFTVPYVPPLVMKSVERMAAKEKGATVTSAPTAQREGAAATITTTEKTIAPPPTPAPPVATVVPVATAPPVQPAATVAAPTVAVVATPTPAPTTTTAASSKKPKSLDMDENSPPSSQPQQQQAKQPPHANGTAAPVETPAAPPVADGAPPPPSSSTKKPRERDLNLTDAAGVVDNVLLTPGRATSAGGGGGVAKTKPKRKKSSGAPSTVDITSDVDEGAAAAAATTPKAKRRSVPKQSTAAACTTTTTAAPARHKKRAAENDGHAGTAENDDDDGDVVDGHIGIAKADRATELKRHRANGRLALSAMQRFEEATVWTPWRFQYPIDLVENNAASGVLSEAARHEIRNFCSIANYFGVLPQVVRLCSANANTMQPEHGDDFSVAQAATFVFGQDAGGGGGSSGSTAARKRTK